MAEEQVIPSVWDLDWFGDFTMYQHPPCTFVLWYAALGVKAAWELIDSLINGEGGGDDGGDGGGGGEDDGKDKEEGGGGGNNAAEEEEPPPEEEG
ncbi:hypothetical protein NQ315_001208 [Exocentrus adspersus]|uniref:Uncharacterized protein n=1 Tax=Exocentrus adspersus TaxID=1586481 RepID=A0AAV8WEM8_9CUCU|nr:hypothetical protein NQ315_001208 [Exocentrus adspersus]